MTDASNVTPLHGDGSREPPHNVEAEQSLLGAILVNNDAYHRVAGTIRAEDFYEAAHRRIWDAAARMIERAEKADPITLRHHFEHDELLEQVGGAQYLARLAGAAVSVFNVDHYARAIVRTAACRRIAEIGQDVRERALDGADEAEPAEIAHEAMVELQAVSEGLAGERITTIGAAADSALDHAERAARGEISAITTGIPVLDRRLSGGLHGGDLVILAARPSMGKTALAECIADAAARVHVDRPEDPTGCAVGFFSLEMSAEQLAARALARRSGVPASSLMSGRMPHGFQVSGPEIARAAEAGESLRRLPVYIEATPALDIGQIAARTRGLRRRYGSGLIIIDYLQLIRTDPRAQRLDIAIGQITQQLKALAKELGVAVLLLSQLNRQVEQRPSKRPQLSDLRESGAIEQDADTVLLLYREAYYHEREEPPSHDASYGEWAQKMERIRRVAELQVAKQRNGPTSTGALYFDAAAMRFGEFERDQQDQMEL